MKLVQVRACDGECCKESPRFPNAEHSDCIYHDTTGGKEAAGCALMRGDETISDAACVSISSLSPDDVFNQTCELWPANTSAGDDLGGCCWQWVENDD